MQRFSIKQLIWFTGIVWSIFAVIAIVIPSSMVFHLINPISIALGVVLVMVYSAGLIQLLKEGPWSSVITPAHLLTFGITLNWVGMIVRMARWFVTGEHPSVVSDIDFWIYNFGLWVSIWAGTFLLGAASVAIKPFKVSTMLTIFLIVFSFLLYWGEHLHIREI